MNIFREIAPLRAYLHSQRQNSSSIGLVPTMGALHQGHISLIEQSRRENSVTVCSIYVNPSQFNNPVDFQKYPRTLDEDIRMLEDAKCDAIFCPGDAEMYRGNNQFSFEFGAIGNILEGEFRPGHFNGVAMVVSKLFNIVHPHRAYFGLKDFQQLKVISQLVESLHFDVRLVPVPIIREADGLAMSSRNRRLSTDERKVAPQIYQCLLKLRQQLLEGLPWSKVQPGAEQFCHDRGIRLEYAALADAGKFHLLNDKDNVREGVLLMAAYVGEVRLIDNLMVG